MKIVTLIASHLLSRVIILVEDEDGWTSVVQDCSLVSVLVCDGELSLSSEPLLLSSQELPLEVVEHAEQSFSVVVIEVKHAVEV